MRPLADYLRSLGVDELWIRTRRYGDRSNLFFHKMLHDNYLFMLDKRQSRRRKMVLPVKISVGGSSGLAHTVDITDAGAALGGVRMQLHTGSIVGLQRGSQKSKFRIAWVRELAPNELRVGIECLEKQSNFWGVDLSDREKAEQDQKAFMTFLSGGSKAKQL